MKCLVRCLGLWITALALASAGCSSSGGSGANIDGGAGAAGDSGNGNDTGNSLVLPFAASNFAAPAAPSLSGPLVLTGDCTVDTDAGSISCAEDGQYAHSLIEQNDPDRSRAALFTSLDLTIEASATVTVTGSYPAIFLVYGEARISGMLRAVPYDFNSSRGEAGGFSSPQSALTIGLGPGGGGAGATDVGASGGGFCGKGGGANPGASYGNAAIRPLLGGSSGGSGTSAYAGAGGGAVQIVARDVINVAATGKIHVGGGGGQFGGSPTSQPGSGGGAGGAILLEAPDVRVAGVLASNGGGGGGADVAGQTGTNGQPSSVPAAGGTPNGGAGAAGAMVDGTAGTLHGGGGGGVGWIRINTSSGSADVASATLSPSATTTCFSQGVLD